MNREGTFGAAAVLAIAAAVGFSVQTGSKPSEGPREDQTRTIRRSKPAISKGSSHKDMPGCGGLREALEDFLDIRNLRLPEQCYEQGDYPPVKAEGRKTTFPLNFVIATLPDPVHTHLSMVFDQFSVAIQEGAQDEQYDFDSSWLPWDDDDSSYALLADDKSSIREKKLKEEQPGIILFRKTIDCLDEMKKQPDCSEHAIPSSRSSTTSQPTYKEGLIVFVVGEEATYGIHKKQFRNAISWIHALGEATDVERQSVAILGPTYSGSLPSLAQLLPETKIAEYQFASRTRGSDPLAIYSGSVSSRSSATSFRQTLGSRAIFHSFVQSDDEILGRFCTYIQKGKNTFDPNQFAIVSEDETAYGRSGISGMSEQSEQDCFAGALTLYYPRDISALRGAYQTKSLFESGASPQPTENKQRNLPTDLADPSGQVHDSIRSYGGNQTPLNQEALLMQIVAALRDSHARYVLLRSSSTLDQVFLTNFLRRGYPDGRIVILGSDLMFLREQGSTGLSGALTLNTYPLFSMERRWTEDRSLPAADRIFSADTAEGTYVAFRLLLNSKQPSDTYPHSSRCHVRHEDEATIFLPSIICGTDVASCSQSSPLPDYAPPFWTLSCRRTESTAARMKEGCIYPAPPTWLSVISANAFWPIAFLAKSSQKSDQRDESVAGNLKTSSEPLPMPLGMKIFWLMLAGCSMFHAWCCWSGSYTAKPAFRAHFASTGDARHRLLVFSGSCCVAFLAMVAGWGSGAFSFGPDGWSYSWAALCFMTGVWLMAWIAILANSRTTRKLSLDLPPRSSLRRMKARNFTLWNYLASALFIIATLLFYLLFIVPVESRLDDENRALTYWRAMHLSSGVSPLVPIVSILIGLYLTFWLALHGLALFGPDRPRLPSQARLRMKDLAGKTQDFLRMFSAEDAAVSVECAAMPLVWKAALTGCILFTIFLVIPFLIVQGVPVRSLGARTYSIIFLIGLTICCTLSIVQAWRLTETWKELKRLLNYLDRLPLRRTLAALHGFSWGSVWTMSGNVLEVRYKVISRQMECMNHTIASLQSVNKYAATTETNRSLAALARMRRAGTEFAKWYSKNYREPLAGNLKSFRAFQKIVAAASGALLTQLLLPAWREEEESLIAAPKPSGEDKEGAAATKTLLARDPHVRNAEEFVCLNYLAFVQNVLGRMRTMAVTIVVLFLAATIAVSTYPFDPRPALSAVLITLFVVTGVVIVKVYADMHRDATLSHVTNTKPGELGVEFWFKVVGFGLAPLIGLMTRLFPSVTDFIFSWLQPGMASLK